MNDRCCANCQYRLIRQKQRPMTGQEDPGEGCLRTKAALAGPRTCRCIASKANGRSRTIVGKAEVDS